ncbi:MAG TPA: DUF3108 domain-containing protein [Devosiaceae bacterium]|nr:DUF3108 domain-containing protein [Devosiaceae bacterium]
MVPAIRPIRRALICGSAAALAAMAAPAAAAPFVVTGSYVITLRGINIAEAEIGFSDDGETYRVAISGSVAGLAQLVASGTATLSSAGRSRPDRLASDSFSLTTRTAAEAFSLGFEARNGTVHSEFINPPLDPSIDRVPVRSADRVRINDPIAAFLIKAERFEPSLCEKSLNIYTGIERYDMDLSYVATQQATSQRTGYQGPVILCSIRYRPISGHFASSESTAYLAQSDRFLVWYAPLFETGFVFPYRMIMGTAYGDLSLVLTRLAGE